MPPAPYRRIKVISHDSDHACLSIGDNVVRLNPQEACFLLGLMEGITAPMLAKREADRR